MEHVKKHVDESVYLRFKRISWNAILAGVNIAVIKELRLSLLGLGIGLSSF